MGWTLVYKFRKHNGFCDGRARRARSGDTKPVPNVAARATVAAQEATIAAGDVDLFHREDERFHHAFSVFAGREGDWGMILVAKARLGRFVRLFGQPERLPVVIAEHRAILDAL